jgi:tight adherence protein C
VIQAEELGNGMARTLSGQSAALREIRRLTAEEQAGKATIKLMFPLAAFMMPALLILIMGPAVLQTLQMFNGR